ncbi:MAG: 50S ribosomal protein L21 [Thermoanaerobaculia bacterium]|nr:50S ribosomal protein L21 [Thermoanaerobaculia bacterium]
MYAVIQTGGKQYRVTEGDVVDVERLSGVSTDSPDVTFDHVLMVGGDDVKVGAPNVDGAKVTAKLLAEVRGPKITVFKMKRRKQYRRKTGHRQDLHRIRIENIEA